MKGLNVQKHLELLGFKVRDVVTGFEGIVETISFDLYGCMQAVVRTAVDDKGNLQDGRWFDLKRLEVIGDAPVMAAPTFEVVPGGTEKPAFHSSPVR